MRYEIGQRRGKPGFIEGKLRGGADDQKPVMFYLLVPIRLQTSTQNIIKLEKIYNQNHKHHSQYQ